MADRAAAQGTGGGDKARIGVYGLGTMGRALALNMAEEGFDVAVGNRDSSWIADLADEAADFSGSLRPQMSLEAFVQALAVPRTVLFMIPSGAPLDDMIAQITPLLDKGDTVIDGGNSNFHDTRRRDASLAAQGLRFIGMGVSGGEEGARHGPSIMVGGPAESYATVRDIVEAVAAKYQGDPCAAHLGPDGAGIS